MQFLIPNVTFQPNNQNKQPINRTPVISAIHRNAYFLTVIGRIGPLEFESFANAFQKFIVSGERILGMRNRFGPHEITRNIRPELFIVPPSKNTNWEHLTGNQSHPSKETRFRYRIFGWRALFMKDR